MVLQKGPFLRVVCFLVLSLYLVQTSLLPLAAPNYEGKQEASSIIMKKSSVLNSNLSIRSKEGVRNALSRSIANSDSDDTFYQNSTTANDTTISGMVPSASSAPQVPANNSSTSLPFTIIGTTNMPATQFTPHVLALISSINRSSVTRCPNYYKLEVGMPMTVPIVRGFYSSNNKDTGTIDTQIENAWTKLMVRIFSRPGRVLQSNVTFGTTWGDYNGDNPEHRSCIGSSNPGGTMSITNFLTMKAQVAANDLTVESVWGKFAVPWENRSTIPVFRGTGYGAKGEKCETYQDVLADPQAIRLKAVDFSVDHPSLLDARLTQRTFKASCWKFNATNGLDKIMLVDDVASELYYTNYQVALVLGGIGAAFRLDAHLSTGTAVVLQQFYYEEWFTSLMQPFVHFIPLAEDLSNLNETMHWIRDHPVDVRAIGERGQSFYQEYLSFSRNEEHIFELLFRLSSISSAS